MEKSMATPKRLWSILGPILGMAGVVLVLFLYLGEWNKNYNSPALTQRAAVIDTRRVSNQEDDDFYVTFQLDDGRQMEFNVAYRVYFKLEEGMPGELAYRGSWFLSFANDDIPLRVAQKSNPASVAGPIAAIGIGIIIFCVLAVHLFRIAAPLLSRRGSDGTHQNNMPQ